MKITQVAIGLSPKKYMFQSPKGPTEKTVYPIFEKDDYTYFAEIIRLSGNKMYYRVDGITIEISPSCVAQVLKNPRLRYFTAALRLHLRIDAIIKGEAPTVFIEPEFIENKNFADQLIVPKIGSMSVAKESGMKVFQIVIGLCSYKYPGEKRAYATFEKDDNTYYAEIIEQDGKTYYRVDGVTIAISALDAQEILKEPTLRNDSVALKLHLRIVAAIKGETSTVFVEPELLADQALADRLIVPHRIHNRDKATDENK